MSGRPGAAVVAESRARTADTIPGIWDLSPSGILGSLAGRLSDELRGFLQSGLAIVVATRDDELRPEIARGWGLELDRDRATLCLGVPPGSRSRANLEANGAVAVTCSRPSTYRTVQLKGASVELREPDERQRTLVRRHLEAFVEEVRAVGVRPEGARTFLGTDLCSVTFVVHEVYDQTPGEQAGQPL